MADQMLAPAEPKPETSLVEQFREPILRLRNEVDRVFEDFPVRWPAFDFSTRLAALLPAPAVEMTETDKAYKVTVEVPGIAAADIDVEAEKGLLVIKGEKKEEREEKERNYQFMERSFGRFQRSVELPSSVDPDKVEATYKNGTLTVTLSKKPEAQRKKIEVKQG